MKSINIDIYSGKKSHFRENKQISNSQLAMNWSKQKRIETVNFNQFIYCFFLTMKTLSMNFLSKNTDKLNFQPKPQTISNSITKFLKNEHQFVMNWAKLFKIGVKTGALIKHKIDRVNFWLRLMRILMQHLLNLKCDEENVG